MSEVKQRPFIFWCLVDRLRHEVVPALELLASFPGCVCSVQGPALRVGGSRLIDALIGFLPLRRKERVRSAGGHRWLLGRGLVRVLPHPEQLAVHEMERSGPRVPVRRADMLCARGSDGRRRLRLDPCRLARLVRVRHPCFRARLQRVVIWRRHCCWCCSCYSRYSCWCHSCWRCCWGSGCRAGRGCWRRWARC